MLGVAGHRVANAARYLLSYREDSGYPYLVLLVNPRFDSRAALSVATYGAATKKRAAKLLHVPYTARRSAPTAIAHD
jgi:hypothetical protein